MFLEMLLEGMNIAASNGPIIPYTSRVSFFWHQREDRSINFLEEFTRDKKGLENFHNISSYGRPRIFEKN
jgi:hypothetical protein